MSQTSVPSSADPADQAAAQAVVTHHTHLAAELDQRVAALFDEADADRPQPAGTARQHLVDFVRHDILTHARAEEQALYPPAAALPQGRLLVAGMVAEHHALTALLQELAGARSPVRAAAAARALSALFAAHLHKENDLVLPLLLGAPDVSLTRILAGMHDLLGTHHGADGEGAAAGPVEGGCGSGGCGCGGDRRAEDSGRPAAAPVMTVDTRLDVRDIPHERRHALVLSTVGALPPGQAVVLVAAHAPRPVLAEIDARFGGQIQAQWLQSGPPVWQVRLERLAQPA